MTRNEAVACASFAMALAMASGAGFAEGPLTPEQKALLEGAISRDAAVECGRTEDAACLERIVGIKDAGLVGAFDEGMRRAQVAVLSPAVESVVVAHFDDGAVGQALRGFSPRYATRSLFDLHYARIADAYRNDEPSFQQILRTDLPGIEPRVLEIAGKYASTPEYGNAALMFLASRHYPGVVEPLFAALAEGYVGRGPSAQVPALGALLGYPSPQIWRRASDEVERLHAAGRLDDAAFARARASIAPLLAQPDAALERMRQSQAWEAYVRRRSALHPGASQVYALRDRPREYVPAYLAHLRQLEPLAAEAATPLAAHEVAYGYLMVGLVERFDLGDPAAAIVHFGKAAAAGEALARMATADTYQFALHDRARAIAAYREALAEAGKAPGDRRFEGYGAAGSPINAWWHGWLTAEVRFLEKGERFHGTVTGPEVAGCFDALVRYSGNPATVLAKGLPNVYGDSPFVMRSGPGPSPAQAWANAASAVGHLDRKAIAAGLEALPPSHLVLLATMRHASVLPEAAAITRFFERNDPSGYWSACLLGSVRYVAQRGEAGRAEALSNGFVAHLPGLALPPEASPLAAAAADFMASRGFRVKISEER